MHKHKGRRPEFKCIYFRKVPMLYKFHLGAPASVGYCRNVYLYGNKKTLVADNVVRAKVRHY